MKRTRCEEIFSLRRRFAAARAGRQNTGPIHGRLKMAMLDQPRKETRDERTVRRTTRGIG